MHYTLVLTRQPTTFFDYHTHAKDNPKKMVFAIERGRFGTLVVLKGPKVNGVQLLKDGQQGAVEVPGGTLDIACPAPVTEVVRYTTIERFDHGMVSLRRQDAAYGVTFEPNNPVVIKLARTHGNCFRVHGGHTSAQRGILIHAAPHVGWLTGCISPRTLGDHTLDTDSTFKAMDELFKLLGPRHADLYITDS